MGESVLSHLSPSQNAGNPVHMAASQLLTHFERKLRAAALSGRRQEDVTSAQQKREPSPPSPQRASLEKHAARASVTSTTGRASVASEDAESDGEAEAEIDDFDDAPALNRPNHATTKGAPPTAEDRAKWREILDALRHKEDALCSFEDDDETRVRRNNLEKKYKREIFCVWYLVARRCVKNRPSKVSNPSHDQRPSKR